MMSHTQKGLVGFQFFPYNIQSYGAAESDLLSKAEISKYKTFLSSRESSIAKKQTKKKSIALAKHFPSTLTTAF